MSDVVWSARRSDAATAVWRVTAMGQERDVEVRGGDDPLILDAAVRRAFGLPSLVTTKRYTIRETTSSHGGPFELEEDTTWTVYEEDRPILRWTGGTSHDYDGVGWSAATGAHGVSWVVLSADGGHVIAGDTCDMSCYSLP